MKYLLVLLLVVSACKKQESGHPNVKALVPLVNPVVFARYETLPALLRSKPGPCSNAFGFKAPDKYRLRTSMDLCGPVPQKTDLAQKNPWVLQNGFKSFHWEQDLQEGENLQLEIIGSNGIPMPSKASVTKTGQRILVQLKPSENLPGNTVLVIAANLFDSMGRKIGTWKVPFKLIDN